MAFAEEIFFSFLRYGSACISFKIKEDRRVRQVAKQPDIWVFQHFVVF